MRSTPCWPAIFLCRAVFGVAMAREVQLNVPRRLHVGASLRLRILLQTVLPVNLAVEKSWKGQTGLPHISQGTLRSGGQTMTTPSPHREDLGSSVSEHRRTVQSLRLLSPAAGAYAQNILCSGPEYFFEPSETSYLRPAAASMVSRQQLYPRKDSRVRKR